MSVINNGLLLGAGADGYQISRSVRLRQSASAYLQRTNATTGTDPLKFTVSGWVKRGLSTAAYFPLLGSNTGSNAFVFIGFQGDNLAFRIRTSAPVDVVRIESRAVYRDFSAWYHIVAVYDSANATSTERVKLYVNGLQLTAFGTATYPSLNQAPTGDFLTDMQIGRTNTNNVTQNYGDGYLTEINFIDGQALTPSSFGETNVTTGVWQPKKYTGTYGTNGFYLNFSDNSGATATTIGKDYSGNGNNWTPNIISVTAGVTYDSMIDVPTLYADGGNGRGNYAVWNPLNTGSTYTNGNLLASSTTSAAPFNVESTVKTSTTGKWYAEITVSGLGAGNPLVGIGNNLPDQFACYRINGTYVTSGAGASSSGTPATFTTNDVIGVAYDADAGTVTFYKNGVQQAGGFTGVAANGYSFVFRKDSASGDAFILNCGQRPFTYTPPTGFVALNTQNLPTPTISNGAQYMAATLYTGNGSTQSIANTVNGISFQPDFVWIKSRSNALSHKLVNSVVGIQKALSSDSTAAESSDTGGVTAFNSNGFTIGTTLAYNTSAATFVGWQWKESASAGFDIVTYTGDGTTNRTVAHSLGVQPSMFIIKARSAATTSWMVHHKDLGNNGGSPAYLQYLQLESTAAKAASTSLLPVVGLSSTTFPTSGATNNTNVNGNGTTYVAHLFSEVLGYSKFGSYTGNGSADGPFVFCGFRPRFIMVKRTDSTSNWTIHDTSRDLYNVALNNVFANLSDAEAANANTQNDILSNGFKVRHTAGVYNANGGTYIFAAFAENPFKNSLAR